MRKLILVSVLILFSAIDFLAHSQPVIEKKSGYKDFVLNDQYIWLLTNEGKVRVVSQELNESVDSIIEIAAPAVALTLDRNGNVIVAHSNRIWQWDREIQRWTAIALYSGTLTGLVFDSKNQCFLITNKGLFFANQLRAFFPDSTKYLNEQIKGRTEWHEKPAYLIDKQDRIWLGFDYGEWGGDVFCFDIPHKAFVELTMDSVQMSLNPVSSFCEDPNSVYMSGGLSHMFMTHGSIIKFTHKTAHSLLASKDRETPVKVTRKEPDGKEKTETWTTWKGGHQIGPVAYNSTNQCLYFYSQYGIFKGKISTDLSTITHWSTVIKPMLNWTGERPNAAGPAMNLLKMQFNPKGNLFFLSEHNGLGIVDGKKLRFIQ